MATSFSGGFEIDSYIVENYRINVMSNQVLIRTISCLHALKKFIKEELHCLINTVLRFRIAVIEINADSSQLERYFVTEFFYYIICIIKAHYTIHAPL